MMRLKAGDIAKAVGGALLQGSAALEVKGVSTDSRKIRPGEVFFALKGPNFDGGRFVRDVFLKGAAGAVIGSVVGSVAGSTGGAGELGERFCVIEVKDTLRALGDLAAYIRALHKIPLVAISGSAGKTTTKEMAASILERSRKVLKTEGNMNNLVGLPLTLFGLEEGHEAAVVELGISEEGEMERLIGICSPDVAVLTNIGRGHLLKLGTIEGVARAKGPLFTALSPGGVKAVNLDDPWVVRLAGDLRNTVTYSLKEDSDVRVMDYKAADGLGHINAVYSVRGKAVSVRLNSPSMANVINGAAAIAAALPLEVTLDDIRDGLGSFAPVHGRMEVLRVNGLTVIDDTYNANPESVAEALKTLKNSGGRKVAVLGDMLELGQASTSEHRESGRLAAALGLDIVVAIGDWSRDVADGALSGGLSQRGVFAFGNKRDALSALKDILREGDTVLVKGSRATRLEEIVEGLKGFKEVIKACG